jgi:hypothetical protein
LENQYKYIEYAGAFSLSRTLSLSKRTATRSSLFEELKEADLFHSGEKRRIKRRERDIPLKPRKVRKATSNSVVFG